MKAYISTTPLLDQSDPIQTVFTKYVEPVAEPAAPAKPQDVQWVDSPYVMDRDKVAKPKPKTYDVTDVRNMLANLMQKTGHNREVVGILQRYGSCTRLAELNPACYAAVFNAATIALLKYPTTVPTMPVTQNGPKFALRVAEPVTEPKVCREIQNIILTRTAGGSFRGRN